MNTSIRFKNLESSDALRSYVSDKLNRMEKYFNSPAEASVVLSIEKFRHTAEINVSGDRMLINCKEETEEMYSAIDMALDKLEVQIKRGKQKSRDFRPKAGTDESALVSETEEESDRPRIHLHPIEYKPMDVDEAVLQMELVRNNFLVFTNARSRKVNVLYRKKDGNYGLIQPRP